MSYYRHPPNRYSSGGLGFPPVTPMVRSIMIACAVVWVGQFTLGRVLRVVDEVALFGIVPAKVLSGWIWQPFTYMWLHGGAFHILFNLLILWMIGAELERHWGGRAFLRYYLVCGVGAGLFITAAGWFWNPHIPTLGASGAIYGLILAFGMIFSERIILFMMIIPMRARTLAWILFAIAFIMTFDNTASGVSHVAHLGGMVVGYLYLKRAWRVGEFSREIRWRLRRRRFKVMPPKDDDWIH